MLAVEEIVSCLVFARLLAHLHPELFPHPLVHPGCITYQYQGKTEEVKTLLRSHQ